MIKLFVTGGTGFVGSAFINEAVKKNYFVYAVTRKKKEQRINNLKWLYGSIGSNWVRELQESDILIHFASAGVNNKNISFKNAFLINVIESYQLLMNAIKANCKKWIIISSCYENIFENKKKIYFLLNINILIILLVNLCLVNCLCCFLKNLNVNVEFYVCFMFTEKEKIKIDCGHH